MNYTTNFNLRLPERNEQFNLDDWNNNTTSIDSAMQTNKTNISNNATNITSILNGLSTVNTSNTSSIYYKLMKLIYPVGSLYWSSKSTNPASLFGGTWVQIKDRFVLACGDTYKTVGATGGASSVTLSVSNMPSHSHSFTPSGSVSAHSHGLNNHTHSFSHTHSTNSQGSHSHSTNTTSKILTGSIPTGIGSWGYHMDNKPFGTGILSLINYDGSHEIGSSGDPITVGGFSIDATHTHNTDSRGLHSHTTNSQSTSTTGGNTGNTTNATPTFTGTAGTTGSSGSGTSFSILPPYVVKYCWERTA